jgi:deoxyribonuclease IV
VSPGRDELGAHVSIAGGLALAPPRGRQLGCGAIQIFVKNQRQWAAPPLTSAAARAFRRARRDARLRHAFAHGSYLVNLACPDPAGWRQAVDTFTDELRRAAMLGLDALVIHPGSHLGAGAEAGLDAIAHAIDEALRATHRSPVKVALENTAGAGHVLGRTFSELRAILERLGHPRRVGVCIDTCHLFVAGYDIRTPAGYALAMAECTDMIGAGRVLAFHLNDAKAPLGSGLDRHENIGRGFLGLRPFRLLLNDRRFARVPKVLETPKEPEPTADLRNLATLRRLRRRLTAPRSRRPVGTAR